MESPQKMMMMMMMMMVTMMTMMTMMTMTMMMCTCNCLYRKSHFVVQGSFTKASIQEFERRCQPSSIGLYGRFPKPGEVVSSYSGAYPYKLVSSMASGSLRAKRGEVATIPHSTRLRSLREVSWPEGDQSVSLSGVDPFPARPPHEDPEWVIELSDGLAFRELFRFHFKKPGHINVNEYRTFKSWMKAAAKSHPDSRMCGLLDSRVTIDDDDDDDDDVFFLGNLQGFRV